MREIKFRAWNDGEMVNNVSLAPDNIPYICPEGVDDQEEFMYYPEAVLMQYTGLKDKNGTEIYEGDIVAFTDKPLAERSPEHGGPKKNREIRWTKNGYNLKKISKDGAAYGVEVIGNIYENPELL